MKQSNKKLLFSIVGALCLVFLAFYILALRPNTKHQETAYVYIPSGADFSQVKDSISPLLKSPFLFSLWSWVKRYPEYIKPGRYAISPNSNNRHMVLKLRGGLQDPIQVRLPSKNNYRKVLAAVANQLECDAASLEQVFSNILQQERGVDSTEFPCYLVPNTYEFYWNGDCQSVAERILSFYHQFWTDERKAKAEKLGLSPCEVSTLASIVQKETAKQDEMPRVAGVYLNRLDRRMRLQADPTLVFAIKDRVVGRVLNVDKKIESPYNTYKYYGLPPGPICVPEKHTVDATLNAEKHDYLYFCASEEFTGYHNFAKSYRQHLQNAAKYQRELNRRRIYR